MKDIVMLGVYVIFGLLITIGLLTTQVDSNTTTIPMDSSTLGYCEYTTDVRLVVVDSPLVTEDIQDMIKDGYKFMTVVMYKGQFYWYFVRYECYSDVLFWYEDIPPTIPWDGVY